MDTVDQANLGVWNRFTETGWPVSGLAMGAATASQSNAQQAWSSIACAVSNNSIPWLPSLVKANILLSHTQAHIFMCILQDAGSSPSFGLVDAETSFLGTVNCLRFSPTYISIARPSMGVLNY